MTRIFLSYSRSDALAANYISRELMARSADVFVDYQSLRGGDNFTQRIGEEISAADSIVLLLSPHSVESRWVQAEISWSFDRQKTIVPVLLNSETSFENFWFLIDYELVDFENWVAGKLRPDAIEKLAVALGLPTKPTQFLSEIPEQTVLSQLVEDEGNGAAPYRVEDLEQLFAQAVKFVDQNPERSNYLADQVLRADPDYAEGQARELRARGDSLLKPGRLAKLHGQAATALEKGDWARAESIGNDMLVIDESDTAAQKIIDTSRQKMAEEAYQRAQSESETGDWQEASRLLDEVWRLRPEFGDPRNIVQRHPITALLSQYLTFRGTLDNFDSVTALALAPCDTLLAVALARPKLLSLFGKVRRALGSLWASLRAVDVSMESPHRICGGVIMWNLTSPTASHMDLYDHGPPVLTMDYSGDAFASLSSDGRLAIRSGDGLQDLQEVDLRIGGEPQALTVANLIFGPEGLVVVGGFGDTLALWRPTCATDAVWTNSGLGNVATVSLSPDGSSVGVGRSGGPLSIYDTANGAKKGEAAASHRTDVCSMVFSPDSRLLATCAGARPLQSDYDPDFMLQCGDEICIWDVPSAELRQILTPGQGPARGFYDDLATAVAPVFQHLGRRQSRVPDALPGERVGTQCLVFTPDRTLLAGALSDGSVRLWRLTDGEEVGAVKQFEARVVSFSQTGDLLFIAADSGDVVAWGLPGPRLFSWFLPGPM